jgi:hypothetical protein
MPISRHPQSPCGLCGALFDVTLYDDGSIRGTSHLHCPKAIKGQPADPPHIWPRGRYFPLSSTPTTGAP